MNIELKEVSSVVSLATAGVLVSVDVNVWSATKQDRVISDEVTASKNADHSAGRFVKNLLADDIHHKKISNYRQTIYNWMQRSTYEFNKAQRILPTQDLAKFKEEYTVHEVEFEKLLNNFVLNYANIVSDMAFKQGDMFNRNDYPSADQVRAKFGVRLYVSEVPTQDWRVTINEDIASDLKQQYEKQANEIVTGILNEQVGRLVEVMRSIEHCCGVNTVISQSASGEGEVKTKNRKIYDTTIDKAKELCALYKDFNLTNNAELEEVVGLLSNSLDGVNAEILRESGAMRAKVQDDVSKILSKFNF